MKNNRVQNLMILRRKTNYIGHAGEIDITRGNLIKCVYELVALI
jgi:hypothetical protein